MYIYECIIIILFCIYLKKYSIFGKKSRVLEKKIYMDRYEGPVRSDDTIFISIASYRDINCSTTLSSIYENASEPDRVFVGICQQNAPDDDDCIQSYHHYNPNIRILRINNLAARGPCYARYLCSCLYNGETYYLQIDSHTIFIPDWDSKLISMMKNLPNNAVISAFIQPIDMKTFGIERSRMGTVPITCRVGITDELLGFGSHDKNIEKIKDHLDEPNFTLGVAGGFMCMHGYTLIDVPFDANLDMLFQGEEVLYSARLFTHGYDFYPMTESIAYHYYTRGGEPKFWDDMNLGDVKISPKEIQKSILSGSTEYIKSNGNLGLGNVRPIKEYWELIGYNPETKDVYKDKCSSI